VVAAAASSRRERSPSFLRWTALTMKRRMPYQE
jgi:hypothetical protein